MSEESRKSNGRIRGKVDWPMIAVALMPAFLFAMLFLGTWLGKIIPLPS